ncbi:polysaccharide deacetylase family protein [Micromonospora sp. DT81.3]|uniref:polysaccharide deacetylase family protein n=1 Tax=Micromonospora sp. DT81.3 TaxID=3416523 RepID=UPI003CF2DECD
MKAVWIRRGYAGVAIAAMLGLAACAPDRVNGWRPTAWPASFAVVTDPPQPLDAAAVAGLDPQRLRIDEVGVQARYTRVFGQGALNDRIEGMVREAIAGRVAASGVAYRPMAFDEDAGMADRSCRRGSTLLPAAELLADPTLGPAGGGGTAVTCDIIAAVGTYIGQRVRVVRSDGADTSLVLYADVATGGVVGAAELWQAGAAILLWDDVVEALRRNAGALSLVPIADPSPDQAALIESALAGTLVAADGSLVLTIGPGFVAPELGALGLPASTVPLTVAVPPASLGTLASVFGAGISAAAAAAVPFAAPAAVPVGIDRVDCGLVPCVALTFDDGPSALTPQLLDTLRDSRAAATFYVLGRSAQSSPDPVRRAAAEGHDIGVHTWDHPHLPELDAAAVARQIGSTRDLLRRLTDQPVATFRPPYGEYNAQTLAAAGLPAILWSIDTRDWAGPSTESILIQGVERPRPGGIVLFHDTQRATVELAPQIIAGLHDRGFTAVTITQLFGGSPPTGGAWRSAP